MAKETRVTRVHSGDPREEKAVQRRELTLGLCRGSPPLLTELLDPVWVSSLKNSVDQKQSMKERRKEQKVRVKNEKKHNDRFIDILNVNDLNIHWKCDLLYWTKLLHTANSTICCLQEVRATCNRYKWLKKLIL